MRPTSSSKSARRFPEFPDEPFNGNLGAITGATIEFGGVSAALSSVAFGVPCSSSGALCDDRFDFTGTPLDGATGDIIILRDFQGGNKIGSDFFMGIAEVTFVVAPTTTVPEPESVALLAAGLGALAVVARRRARQ